MRTTDWLLNAIRTAILSSTVLTSTLPGIAKADDTANNEEAAMRYLGPFAFYTHTAIRVYALANCTHSAMQSPDVETQSVMAFPSIKTKSPSKRAVGLAAVREMFEEDRDVQVTESNGVIRVWVGRVPTDVLRTRLGHVSFDRETRYNPDRVLGAIIGTEELHLAMRSLRLTLPWGFGAPTAVMPENDLPQFRDSVSNITVEQVLDTVAKTWEGQIVVIYLICKQPEDSGERLFRLSTYGQIGPRNSSKGAARVYYPTATVKKSGE